MGSQSIPFVCASMNLVELLDHLCDDLGDFPMPVHHSKAQGTKEIGLFKSYGCNSISAARFHILEDVGSPDRIELHEFSVQSPQTVLAHHGHELSPKERRKRRMQVIDAAPTRSEQSAASGLIQNCFPSFSIQSLAYDLCVDLLLSGASTYETRQRAYVQIGGK